MKFLSRSENELVFELDKREFEALERLLSLFPLVPTGYSQLSRCADPEELGSDEEWMKASLAEAKAEGKKLVQRFFEDPSMWGKAGRSRLLKLSPDTLDQLLQICGDIRVGCWVKLGKPGHDQERKQGLTLDNLEFYLPMQMMSNLQMLFIRSLRNDAAGAEHSEFRLFDRKQVLPWKLGKKIEFPKLAEAYYELGTPGLVAIGGDLTVENLLAAYKKGIFPWSVNPVTWWSPPKRAIIEFEKFHVARSLEKLMRKHPFEVTVNRAFHDVVEGCATSRVKGNWICPEIIDAYTTLHEAGHAHSLECWKDGRLAGGIYGVAVGGLFAAESMFYRESNASKVALVELVRTLQKNGFVLLDIQMLTPTTMAFGATEVSRQKYLRLMTEAVKVPARFQRE